MATRVNKASKQEEVEEMEQDDNRMEQSIGPVAVPDASPDNASPGASVPAKRGRKPGGVTGPRLMWGQEINGDLHALDKALLAGARAVSGKFQGRATLSDLLTYLKSDPVFTSNRHPDGPALSDLLTIGNVRIRWNFSRAFLTYQRAQLSEDEGGIGLDPAKVDLKEWASKAHRGEFQRMEQALMKPRSEGGKDWPSLIVVRGVKGQTFGLSLDDI